MIFDDKVSHAAFVEKFSSYETVIESGELRTGKAKVNIYINETFYDAVDWEATLGAAN